MCSCQERRSVFLVVDTATNYMTKIQALCIFIYLLWALFMNWALKVKTDNKIDSKVCIMYGDFHL